MCYIHLACRAAKQRSVHSCRTKRRSANSVAASLQRRRVAASQRGSRVAASQRQQRRSVAPASQRRSANSVAASLPRRSVAAPTASQRHSSVAASQRQQRRSVTGPTAASQRCSVTASQRHSVAASQRRRPLAASLRRRVAAPPDPGSVTAQRRKPTFRPPLPLHWEGLQTNRAMNVSGLFQRFKGWRQQSNKLCWCWHHLESAIHRFILKQFCSYMLCSRSQSAGPQARVSRELFLGQDAGRGSVLQRSVPLASQSHYRVMQIHTNTA